MFTSCKRLFGVVLMLALAISFAVPASRASANETNSWAIVFNQPNGLLANVDRIVANAGGTVTLRLPEIGAIGARSENPNFAASLAGNPLVKAVGPDVVMQLIPGDQDLGAADAENNGGQASPPGPDPQPGTEPLYNQQWDKMRLNASASGSYAVQPGRRDVVVAVLDTGADVLPVAHPDIAPNLDAGRSRAFVDSATGEALPAGDPNPANWDDRHGHGSWCLSAVGAPINGAGISGVAPNVTLVALKVLSDTGSGSYLALANALVYAGINKFDVASMSLGGYLRHADHGQTLVTIVQRAVEFARENGVTPIAALGNDNFDLSDGRFVQDFIETPGELPGVIGVAATGYYNEKSFYSNYGVGKTDVSAPGGNTRNYTGVPGSVVVPPPYRGLGRVLGAWSTENTGGVTTPQREEECDPATGNCYMYAWVQGTSMATPNAAGVAALIISQYGDFKPDGSRKLHMPPTHVESILQITANNQPCPEPNTVIAGADFPVPTATCQGETGYNNFYGKGIVDALKAVTLYENVGQSQ